MSWKHKTFSSSKIIVAGICFATILAKIVSCGYCRS
jgi:hypothetical protein